VPAVTTDKDPKHARYASRLCRTSMHNLQRLHRYTTGCASDLTQEKYAEPSSSESHGKTGQHRRQQFKRNGRITRELKMAGACVVWYQLVAFVLSCNSN